MADTAMEGPDNGPSATRPGAVVTSRQSSANPPSQSRTSISSTERIGWERNRVAYSPAPTATWSGSKPSTVCQRSVFGAGRGHEADHLQGTEFYETGADAGADDDW